MRTKIIYIGLLVLTVLGMTTCGRVKPQGPANKSDADSTAQALMQMNLLLAIEADRQITDSVRASNLPYVLDPGCFWYYREVATAGTDIKQGMKVEYSAVIRNLATGELLEDITEEVEVGKRTTLRAIDMCMTSMREGETFRVIAPYYDAYGRDGNEYVPPMTNVFVVLTVNNITKI